MDEQLESTPAEQQPALSLIDGQLEWLEGARGVLTIPAIDLELMIFDGLVKSLCVIGVIAHGKQFNPLDVYEMNG